MREIASMAPEASKTPTEASEQKPAIVILAVEDDVLVRFPIAEYLRSCDFQVLEAASAEEAVTLLSTDIAVDFVFSDVRMTGAMSGFALATWIRANRPALPVLLTSGYSGMAGKARDLCDAQ